MKASDSANNGYPVQLLYRDCYLIRAAGLKKGLNPACFRQPKPPSLVR